MCQQGADQLCPADLKRLLWKSNKKKYIIERKITTKHTEYTIFTVKHGGGSIMQWGQILNRVCFHANFTLLKCKQLKHKT